MSIERARRSAVVARGRGRLRGHSVNHAHEYAVHRSFYRPPLGVPDWDQNDNSIGIVIRYAIVSEADLTEGVKKLGAMALTGTIQGQSGVGAGVADEANLVRASAV